MHGNRQTVICRKSRSTTELPAWAAEGAALIHWLVTRKLWQQISERVRVKRQGGFQAADVVLFFLYYFSSARRESIKEFGEASSASGRLLAAVGGRRDFATPSSVSRFLGAVEEGQMRPTAQWLLGEACEPRSVLKHPASGSYDTFGQRWDFFDWDGTSTAIRHRALPEGKDLPAAERRSEQTGTAGYMGRKRGEIRFSRAMLQHAGTALWLDILTVPGRSDTAAAVGPALEAIVQTCRQAELRVDRAVIRADGCAGNVPWITQCQKAGVVYLTRSSHYALFEQPEIQAALSAATWYEVPSSGSGPTRQAAELGEVRLDPSKNTVDQDGHCYESIRTRMVVSRFAGESKSGAGIVIDGWQYELYATALPADAWPAPETVAIYYSRCGQENRFAQEDRELGLDRIMSYHLPGHEWATVIGLFVWNLRIVRGFDLTPPPPRPAEHSPRRAVVCAPTPPPQEHTATESSTPQSIVDTDHSLLANASTHSSPPSVLPASLPDPSPPCASSLAEAMNQLPWDDWGADLAPGFQRSADGAALQCPAGALLPPSAIVPPRQGRAARIAFVAALASCRACDPTIRCVDAPTTGSAKKVTRAIDDALVTLLTPLLAQRAATSHTAHPRRTPIGAMPHKPPTSRPLLIAPAAIDPGQYSATEPLLLPADLRHAARRVLADVRVSVELDSQPKPPPIPGVAASPIHRQRRRLSWTARAALNDLPEEASVIITFDDQTGRLPSYLGASVTS